LKKCSRCGKVQSVDSFHRETRSLDGLHSWCKSCANERRREAFAASEQVRERKRRNGRTWYASNRSAHCRMARNSTLKRKYGITVEEYEFFLSTQGGGCGLCGSPEPKGKGCFHIDHDHATGRVRGVLCHHCNTQLGAYEKMLRAHGAAALESWMSRDPLQRVVEDAVDTKGCAKVYAQGDESKSEKAVCGRR
jgi:hypothetical protein